MTNVSLQLDDKHQAIVIEKENKRITPYLMVGNGIKGKRMKLEAIDLLDEMSKFSSSEMKFFMLLKEHLPWDCETTVVKLDNKSLTTTMKQHVKVGYLKLHKKDLVRRVKRGSYMINPSAIIPLKENEAIKLWRSLTKYGDVPTKKPKPKPIKQCDHVFEHIDDNAEVCILCGEINE